MAVLLGRALTDWGMGWVAGLMIAGLAMQTIQQALRSDHAPLPPSSELGKTAAQGCLAGCGLWFAMLGSMFLTLVPLHLMGGTASLCQPGELPHNLETAFYSLGFLWCLQSSVGALILVRHGPDNVPFSQLALNGLLAYFVTISLKAWPGLPLVALLALTGLSWPLMHSSQALLQAIPLALLLLYCHLLGQMLRKSLGFQVK